MVMHVVLDFTNMHSFMSIIFTHSSSLITSSVFLECAWIYLNMCADMCVCVVYL